jgi:hypothetical protein
MCEEVYGVNPAAAKLPRDAFMEPCSHTSAGVTECMKPDVATGYPDQCRKHQAAIRELLTKAGASPSAP